MSHDGTWRASCLNTLLIPPFHFESTFHRTRRDKYRRWLWRLVGPELTRRTLLKMTCVPFREPTSGSGISLTPHPANAIRLKIGMQPHPEASNRKRSTLESRIETSLQPVDSTSRRPICASRPTRFSSLLLLRPTSKMSHDGGWRAACIVRN